MSRAGLILAAALLGFLGAPGAAQQTTPVQSAAPAQAVPPSAQPEPASVAPAPPPDQQASPERPPPFPPMPATNPHHRWVDVGGSSHRSHHRTPSARHARTHKHEPAKKSAATKTLRWCKSLSHHQLKRHSSCSALIHKDQAELHHKAKHHQKAKHGEKTAHRQKAKPHQRASRAEKAAHRHHAKRGEKAAHQPKTKHQKAKPKSTSKHHQKAVQRTKTVRVHRHRHSSAT